MWFILALLGAFTQATYQVANKAFLKKINEYVLGAGVFFVSAVFLFLISLAKGFPAIGEGFLSALFITGIINIAATIVFFKVLKTTDASLAIPMLSFTPAFAILTSYIFLKEAPSRYGFMGIFFVVVGAYILNSESASLKKILEPFKKIISQKELLYALAVAFLYSISTVYDKVVVLNSDPIFGSAIICFFIATIMAIMVFFKKDLSFKKYKSDFPKIGLSGIFNALSMYFVNAALAMQIVSYVSAIKRTSVLFGVLYGAILFKEKGMGRRFFGAMIMVLGAVLIIVLNK